MLWLLLIISLHASNSQRCSLNCSALQNCVSVRNSGTSPNGTYTLSFASCKSSNISWFCCRDASCTANCKSGKCDNFNEITIQTPPGATSANIQVHDGSLKGNLGSSKELVCGKNGGGTCGGLNVCNLTLALPSNIPTCNLNCSALQDCADVRSVYSYTYDWYDYDVFSVSFASCKSSIGSFCCRDSSCTANCTNGKCNNFNENITIHAPNASANVQVYGGSLTGNLGSSEELVCGENAGGTCGGLNTCNVTLELPPGCIDGNMLMKTKNHGTLAVKDITTGMSVRGKRNGVEGWCAVSSNSALGRGRLVGDFTSNHLVMQHGTLQENGNSGLGREGDLYNLATDCEFTTNSKGVSFTPFSSDSSHWHSRLSISQYYTFFQALRALGTHLPFDIFDVSQYKGNWKKQADRVCNKLVDCLFENKNCELLNKGFDDLVNKNLNADAKKAVKKVFKDGAALAHTAKTHRLK